MKIVAEKHRLSEENVSCHTTDCLEQFLKPWKCSSGTLELSGTCQANHLKFPILTFWFVFCMLVGMRRVGILPLRSAGSMYWYF